MDRLFLDANVLFSAAYRTHAQVMRLWGVCEALLLSSNYAVEEARRNLPEAAQRNRLARLLVEVDVVTSGTFDPGAHTFQLPAKDLPILAGALQSGATHLITGDLRHFGPYMNRRLAGILVVTPRHYLAG